MLKDKVTDPSTVIRPNVNTFKKCIKNYYNKVDAFKVLALWEKLDSNNIIKFYGINEEDTNYLVLETADMGTLRDLYKNHDISWDCKVSIKISLIFTCLLIILSLLFK